MKVLLNGFIFSLFIVYLFTSAHGSSCQRKDSESCKHVGSLKGLVYMMESVSTALSDMLSSAKFRAENIEDGFCISPKIANCSTLSSTDESDHCVRAEPDCKYIFDLGFKESGSYRIWPTFLNHSLIAYCDMETDGGGWTVIQRRGEFGEPHIDFYNTWDEYKRGFGDVQKEFWIGNDILFSLTNEAKMALRIELEDFDGERRFAKYRDFLVRSEVENYKMTIGEYDGNADDNHLFTMMLWVWKRCIGDKDWGDSLRGHSGRDFSTKDRGNDCPKQFKGGWWYSQCHEANLNGVFYHGDHESYADGVNWFHFRRHNHSLKVSEMKIRRCNC